MDKTLKEKLDKLMQDLRTAPPADKAAIGAEYNKLKIAYDDAMRKEQAEKEAKELAEKLAKDPVIDITVPGGGMGGNAPYLHPITLVIREVEEVFSNMGFIIEDGPEIATEYECFDSLNCPKDHPARDMQDTFWLSDGRVLRTQTSAWQNHIMKKYGPTFRAISPGRVFRNEATDATHDNTFFQCEGMMVGEDISIANLIYFMKEALTAVFKKDIKVRLRPGFFPFVEPGFELDASTGKDGGWMEFCGCGMIHPNVLKEGGIDPTKYQGFAFGFGLTRLAMMKYGINEIRHFNSGNLDFLRKVK